MMDKLKKGLIGSILISVILAVTLTYVWATSPSTTFYISSGIYPGAPTYTIWTESGEYFAKNKNGQIAYSSTNASYLIQACIDASTPGAIFSFGAGNFTLDTSIGFLHKQSFIGQGEDLTNITYTDSFGYAFHHKSVVQMLHVKFRELSIYVQKKDAGGIDFAGVSNGNIENVRIWNLASNATIVTDTTRIAVRLYDNNSGLGCYFNRIISVDARWWHKGIEFNADGIGWTANQNQVESCVFRDCYIGVNVETGGQNSISYCDFEANNQGIRISQNYTIIAGGLFELNVADIYVANSMIQFVAFGIPSNVKITLAANSKAYYFDQSGNFSGKMWTWYGESVMSDLNRVAGLDWTNCTLTLPWPAKYAILELILDADTVGAGDACYLGVRPYGTNPTYFGSVVVGNTSTPGVQYQTQVTVLLTPDNVFQYKIGVGTGWQIDSVIALIAYSY